MRARSPRRRAACAITAAAVLVPALQALPRAAAAAGPEPPVYRVRQGDTLTGIADRLGLPVPLLYRINRTVIGTDPDRLLPGQLLVYKDGAAVPARWSAPVYGAPVTAPYRLRGTLWAAGYHTGVDLAVPAGTVVRSVGSGVVTAARWDDAFGRYVLVRMDDGHHVLYAHLQRLLVARGDRVRGGSRIGLSGSSGNATGPHLHFEVRRTKDYGSDVDPVAYLARRGVRI